MKIGVAGTGAVGGYFGGLLKRAGNEVIFLARGNNLERMRENGLTIESDSESFTVEATFTDCYEDFTDVDLLLFCVKSTSTMEMAEKFTRVLKESCMIMTLQNGVDNEEFLGSVFGSGRILSAAAYIQAGVTESGTVKQIGVPPKLVFGALVEDLQERLSVIQELFNIANIEAYPTRDILKIKWKKLLWNVTFNPLTALIEAKVGAIYEDKGLKETAIKICQEAIAVARAAGVEIEEDQYETVMMQGQFAQGHQTSMLQDKLKGKPLELESIAGYIVKKGKELGVETPVLNTIYHLLNFQTRNV